MVWILVILSGVLVYSIYKLYVIKKIVNNIQEYIVELESDLDKLEKYKKRLNHYLTKIKKEGIDKNRESIGVNTSSIENIKQYINKKEK